MALDGRARAELTEQIRLTRARADARTSESRMLAAFRRIHLGQEATRRGARPARQRRPEHRRAPARARVVRALLRAGGAAGARRALPRSVLAPARDARAAAARAGDAACARRRLPRGRHRLRRLARRGLEPAHRAAADDHRARHLLARARHGAGARRVDRGPAAGRRRGRGAHLGAAGVAAATGLVALLPHAVAPGVRAGLAHRHAQRGEPAQAAGRRRARREDRDRPQRRRAPRRRPTRSAGADGGDTDEDDAAATTTSFRCRVRRPKLRVGFVGRVVPIKDVVTFVKACDLALRIGRSRRAHHRPGRRGSGLRRALPRAGRAARPRRSRSASSGRSRRRRSTATWTWSRSPASARASRW